MLSHLLFSISALIILIILIITFFSLNKNNDNLYRVKMYKYLLFIVLLITLIEILDGVFYVYNLESIYFLFWKIRFILYGIFYIFLCNYVISFLDVKNNFNIYEIFWDNKFLLKNVFVILYFILICYSCIFIKPYLLGFSSFLFFPSKSYIYLFLLFVLYVLFIVVIIKKKKIFSINEIISLVGTFILNIIAFLISYKYPEVSFYGDVFVIMLILFYFFKEDIDLVRIDKFEKNDSNLSDLSNLKYFDLYESSKDLNKVLNIINLINNYIIDGKCNDEIEIYDKLDNINIISNDSINIIDDSINLERKYRIDEILFRLSKVMDVLIYKKDIKFVYNIDEKTPSVLLGHASKIYRILLNLLMFMTNNIETGMICVNVGCTVKEDEVILNIKINDTGNGYNNDFITHIFDKSDKYSNNDVNFYLIRKYVESLNGQISAKSKWLVGTTFDIKIVQKAYDLTPIFKNSQFLLQKINIDNYDGKKVIILDNNYEQNSAINKIFEKYCFTVENIKTGKEFINRIKTSYQYDFVLISDNITDVNYMNIISIIRYLDILVNIKCVVAFTSNIVDLDGEFYIKSGFDEYLAKPVDINKLDSIIKKRCK